MSLKTPLGPNQELNHVVLPNGISDFIEDYGSMPYEYLALA